MTVEFRETKLINGWRIEEKYLTQWPNVPDALIPQNEDIVKLHFGDYNETEEKYIVEHRVISGTDLDKIIVIVRKP